MLVKIYEEELRVAVQEFLGRRGVEIKADQIDFRISTVNGEQSIRPLVNVSGVTLEVQAPMSQGPYR